MADDKSFLTQEQYDRLRGELEYLESVQRERDREAIERAKELGDVSANAEYDAACEFQARTEEQIQKIRDFLKRSQVVERGMNHGRQ